MNKIISIGCLIFLICHQSSLAQSDSLLKRPDSSLQRHTIAVFAPLYLDSAFDESYEYRYGKTFPKFINPGLEFYEGVQLAADSLNRTGAALDIFVYDTRSAKSTIAQVAEKAEFSKVELIIGHVAGNEVRMLAEIAKRKNISFINTNIPNDGGVNNNPSLVILNSTLRTHVQAMYRFLQKNYALAALVVFTKKGVQEDLLKNYFTEMDRSTASVPLRLKFVTLNNSFTTSQLASHLDSNRVTMCIAGSLDEQFGKTLTHQLAGLNKKYPVHVLGMPTWDGIKEFEKKEYKGLEVFYSTPFYNGKSDKLSISITNYFKNNIYSRPTDMVFRGYETLMRFGKLLLEHGVNLSSSIGVKKYKVFTDFDIQPVFLNKQLLMLDYFENKKLYFIKMIDGVIRAVY